MKIETVKSTMEHVEFIADNLRDHDVEELRLASGRTPMESLERGLRLSDECYTVLLDDVPVLMYGYKCESIISRNAVIWMLSTPLITEIPTWFLKESIDVIHKFSSQTDKLYNYVWEKNVIAIRWLQWLGFTMFPSAPYGYAKEPFVYFQLSKSNV